MATVEDEYHQGLSASMVEVIHKDPPITSTRLTKSAAVGHHDNSHSAWIHRLVEPWTRTSLRMLDYEFELSPLANEHERLLVHPTSNEDPTTSVSVHWGSIQVDGTKVRCKCCGELETAVAEYRHTVDLMYRRWLLTAQAQRESWQQQRLPVAAIDARTDALNAQMMPQDSFLNSAKAAATDDELMAFICEYSDLSFMDVSEEGALLSDWVTVTHPTTRHVCRSVLRPFAAFAHMELSKFKRTHRAIETGGWCDTFSGVSPSGQVVGLECVVRPFASLS